MAGILHLWDKWEVQILVLFSFLLQVLLLFFTEMCRRRVSVAWAWRILLWLAYLLADSTALYTLGHMSLSSTSRKNQQLVAFWAQFLLVHLGGQDTITAYAMEDIELWLRHLLTLAVQTAGAAYVMYKYISSSGALLPAAVLMFLVGVVKYGEMIYAFKSTSQENIIKFLDGVEMPLTRAEDYPLPGDAPDAEEVLQGAHDLLPICMGQFVDYKVWPSAYLNQAIEFYHGKGIMLELIGMQLSLMRDILYTKAAVIHTRYGCCIRVVSAVSTVTAFILFLISNSIAAGGGSSYSTGDMIVTYILLVGAILLEMASVIRSAMSTWTCALLRDGGRWKQLHAKVLSLRRCVNAAQHGRRWFGSIGQHNLPYFSMHSRNGVGYRMASCIGLEHLWNKLHSRYFKCIVISEDIKKLVLQEIESMAAACQGKEDIFSSYRGQRVLGARWDGFYKDLGCGIEEIGFDGTILAWHYATHAFLCSFEDTLPWVEETRTLVEAVRALSNYMVFLLLESPHLLPSPVRRIQYDRFCKQFEAY